MKWSKGNAIDEYRSGAYRLQRFESGGRFSTIAWILWCGVDKISCPYGYAGRWPSMKAAKAAAEEHAKTREGS